MTTDEAPAPSGGEGKGESLVFDTSVAHVARMYDYVLGGKDNYAADREAAEAWVKIDPGALFSVRANRAFLGRAVTYLAGQAGVRQFLDIGTGIPTAGNTHEVAQAIAPDSRVVYVDYDPIVLAHARALLTSDVAGGTEYIDADLRDTERILGRAREFLDFTKPVAITLVAILHSIPDADDPHAIVATLLDAVPPGSYLALTHLGSDLLDQETRDGLEGLSARSMQQRISIRGRDEVARFFTGTDLVDPGLVRAEEWRPAPATAGSAASSLWGGVGHRR
ncbi:MAG TPA: SAM-dependent methyltransferase [Trebonia sp.]